MGSAMNNPKLLRDILHRAVARYLTVSPRGLHLGREVVPTALGRILGWGPARTLYKDKKPICRSLDGTISVTHEERRCEECTFKSACTGQVRVDLLIRGRAWRLLLAYTSARNFLVYEAELKARKIVIEDVEHRLEVFDRGYFGEVRFRIPSET